MPGHSASYTIALLTILGIWGGGGFFVGVSAIEWFEEPEKITGRIALFSIILMAVITISSLVYSPSNIAPDNAWGGIVIGAWFGGGWAFITNVLCYFVQKSLHNS